MFHYERDNEGNLCLVDDQGEIIDKNKTIGIVLKYHPHLSIPAILLKHGNPKCAKEYYNKMYSSFITKKDFYLKSIANSLCYIESDFDPDELNKCLDITGYVSKLYEKVTGKSYE